MKPTPAVTESKLDILAGNVIRATVTFVPASGTVILANVSIRAIDSKGTLLTPGSITDLTGQVFRCDIPVPDATRRGRGRVRWESSSPQIAIEQVYDITESGIPNA